ncbi:MAG: hypothetical protein MPN21_00045 [Thermoanaerobaculia bacterium]|nr:hypothetical protein [Thermoanaerobaculia bacterium]
MKKLAFALLALSTLLLATPLLAADSKTLEGEFIWEREDENVAGALKAVFEPTGDATWDVSFYFTFEDKDHIYKGTAEGSLTEGELKGEVLSDGEEPHPYEFTGSFAEDGSFSGTHSYTGGEEARPTGTITFTR